MQNGKTEGVNDEQNKRDVRKLTKRKTRHANEQATKKLMRQRNKLI